MAAQGHQHRFPFEFNLYTSTRTEYISNSGDIVVHDSPTILQASKTIKVPRLELLLFEHDLITKVTRVLESLGVLEEGVQSDIVARMRYEVLYQLPSRPHVILVVNIYDETFELLDRNGGSEEAAAILAKLEKVRIDRSKLVRHDDDYTLLTCAICKEDIDGEALRWPCLHLYHEHCIVTWLKSKRTCPLCRYTI